MELDVVRAILAEYDSAVSRYGDFAQKIKHLVKDLLNDQEIRVLAVTARVKDRNSLDGKLQRGDAHYQTLADVTDIAGVRITTFLADDVDRIGNLIEREFTVDKLNSIDKRAVLDENRFGYLSLHYIVQLSAERAHLSEYSRFPSLKAEIQVRSILQHAWAEIEHDLWYKATTEVPRTIRRRFSRLAGLFELADQEFIEIREALQSLKPTTPLDLATLDDQSLGAFVEFDSLVSELDRYIAAKMSASVVGTDPEKRLAEKWHRLDIYSVGNLRTALIGRASKVRAFARDWLRQEEPRPYTYRGISLFYLRYVMLAERGDRNLAHRVLADVGALEEERERLITRIFEMLPGGAG